MNRKTNLLLLLIFFANASFGQEKNDARLLVFIGEKIEIERFYPERKAGTILMDAAFKAKYRIIENVYGDYSKDTIEFEAYDHYGIPAFSKFQHVLLYVIETNGKLYHEKYQYSDVYMTKNGKWAAPFSTIDYEHPLNEKTKIKPVRIKFAKEVSIDVSRFDKEGIQRWFPSTYYKVKGDKAIAKRGNYIEELFQLKKDGVLKARGYKLE